MSRRSRAAVARSTAGDRTLVLLTGLVLLIVGVLVVLLGAGTFGGNRANRPLLDPVLADWATTNAAAAQWFAIAAALVLVVIGLTAAVRSLRPEPRPDVLLSALPGERLTVEYSAIQAAVRGDAEAIEGVSRAKVRVVGTELKPALRIYLWLVEGADVKDVWADLDNRVLARARTAFAVEALPTAVRIELEAASAGSPRVH